jgi:hypothetical protein
MQHGMAPQTSAKAREQATNKRRSAVHLRTTYCTPGQHTCAGLALFILGSPYASAAAPTRPRCQPGGQP